MGNKQTALQSFWDKIALKLSVEQINEFLPDFEHAKEMEKQQLKDTVINTYKDVDGYSWGLTAHEYYNEQFKKK